MDVVLVSIYRDEDKLISTSGWWMNNHGEQELSDLVPDWFINHKEHKHTTLYHEGVGVWT